MQQQLVVTDRSFLESLLNEPSTTLMLVLARESSEDERVYYDLVKHVREPWRRVVLLFDPGILKPDEQSEWRLKAPGHFVVLAGPKDGKRKAVQKGPLSWLLGPSGTPSLLRVRKAFAGADASREAS